MLSDARTASQVVAEIDNWSGERVIREFGAIDVMMRLSGTSGRHGVSFST